MITSFYHYKLRTVTVPWSFVTKYCNNSWGSTNFLFLKLVSTLNYCTRKDAKLKVLFVFTYLHLSTKELFKLRWLKFDWYNSQIDYWDLRWAFMIIGFPAYVKWLKTFDYYPCFSSKNSGLYSWNQHTLILHRNTSFVSSSTPNLFSSIFCYL